MKKIKKRYKEEVYDNIDDVMAMVPEDGLSYDPYSGEKIEPYDNGRSSYQDLNSYNKF